MLVFSMGLHHCSGFLILLIFVFLSYILSRDVLSFMHTKVYGRLDSFQVLFVFCSFALHTGCLPACNQSQIKRGWSLLLSLLTDYRLKPERIQSQHFCPLPTDSAFRCRYLFIEIRQYESSMGMADSATNTVQRVNCSLLIH